MGGVLRGVLRLKHFFYIGMSFIAIAWTAIAQDLPREIPDDAFWQMVSDFSEPDGNFESDNFTSNEDGFQWVIPRLKETAAQGGVYIGVGPEQNFTYIAALRPQLAFIVDIRRQNMLQHLWYKAVFEASSDRADFLSRLFSRQRPSGLDSEATAEDLFAKYKSAQPDAQLHEQNLQAVTDRLVNQRKFSLSAQDLSSIRYIADAFFKYGPDVHYINPGSPNAKQPTYADLMTSKDASGQNRSYLASESNFLIVKDLQRRNLIVPVVGNFAGPKALRRIGEYLKGHGATVTAFYTSNVERYLFGQPMNRSIQVDSAEDWKQFYSNVGALPINDSSKFVRSVTPSLLRALGVERAPEDIAVTKSAGDFFPLLDSMAPFMKAYGDGRIQTYRSVLEPRK
jgi:hypothetical protein